jgi:hypothetical protein
MKTIALIMVGIWSISAMAQVDEIKSASRSNSEKSDRSSSGGSSGSGGGGGSFFLVDLMFGGIGEWQGAKLRQDRFRYPSMVSLDMMFQGGVKPSSYYLLWPRIRGNWGLFSTDFRMNYLIEDDFEGYKHIRTNDWQIIQINLITSRFLTFRVGTGIMTEAFGSKRTFNESAFLFGVHAPDQTKMIQLEYRFSKDWDTGANPRREFGVQYMHQVFSAGSLHGNISAGVVYQKYYNSIEIWGVQAGIVFRFFKPRSRDEWNDDY